MAYIACCEIKFCYLEHLAYFLASFLCVLYLDFGNVMKGIHDSGLVRVSMDIRDVEACGDWGWESNISSMYDANDKKVTEYKWVIFNV